MRRTRWTIPPSVLESDLEESRQRRVAAVMARLTDLSMIDGSRFMPSGEDAALAGPLVEDLADALAEVDALLEVLLQRKRPRPERAAMLELAARLESRAAAVESLWARVATSVSHHDSEHRIDR